MAKNRTGVSTPQWTAIMVGVAMHSSVLNTVLLTQNYISIDLRLIFSLYEIRLALSTDLS